MNIATRFSVSFACAMLVLSTGNVAFGLLFTVAPGGPSGLSSEIVYESPGVVPTAGGAGSALVAGDAIDGFSLDKNDTQFLLCFSVDPLSTGDPLKPPVLGFGFPPFNVTDQAAKGQAAGDAFISTEAYSRAGGPLPVLPSMGLLNNVLAINQSPLYADDFGLLPLAAPSATVPLGTPLDDVVGGGPPRPPAGVFDLFFTLDAASASIAGGPAPYLGGSGADVFFDPTADLVVGLPAPGDEFIYASAATLGLDPNDEIDALVVFDDGPFGSGTWAAGDQILLSLAPGSPTLGILGVFPSDILSISFGGALGLFADHADLGLLPSDNIDMLELVPLVGTAQQTIENKTVPEPATLSLLALGGLMLARRRRQTW